MIETTRGLHVRVVQIGIYLIFARCSLSWRSILASILFMMFAGACNLKHDRSNLDEMTKSSDENGNVNLSLDATTFSKGSVRVLLVDMVHRGPSSFYETVNEVMAKKALQQGPIYILKEGLTYDPGVVDEKKFSPVIMPSRPVDTFPPTDRSQLPLFSKYMKSFEGAYDRIMNSGFYSKERPNPWGGDIPDGSPFGLRGEELDSKIVNQKDRKYGLKFPEGDGIHSVVGDANLLDLHPAYSMLATLRMNIEYYRSYGVKNRFSKWLEDDPDGRFFAHFSEVYMWDLFREESLFKAINNSIESGARVIIIPWGELHTPRIKSYLLKQNFEFQSKETIYFASCKELSGDENWLGSTEIMQLCN